MNARTGRRSTLEREGTERGAGGRLVLRVIVQRGEMDDPAKNMTQMHSQKSTSNEGDRRRKR